ncbi:MAG TPA: class I SAM-dependent methyltransferase [Baekduia sp.]|nr:class I SAM-dependent methyltransferase [Baekduia sp.]
MTDSTMSVPSMFDAQAAAYEAPRRRLIPPFDAFYATAVAALEMLGRPPRRVLDLGAGTGMLAARVAQAHPDAELVLVDGAPAMLEQARATLGPRAQLHVADLADPLPAGGFDAVVSALAIHHLDDPGKQALFARVRAVLPPGGVFVNAEQVAGPAPCFERRYRDWHEASARARGATDAEWAGAEGRMRHDRCADVESQQRWLRAAGFDAADCLFKDHRFAVLVARRAAAAS